MVLNLRPLPRDYQPLDVAIEPRSASDRDKFIAALERLAAEHESVQPDIDHQNGIAILRASDERHIEVFVEALRAVGVPVNVGAPQIAYREILSSAVERDYTHKKPSGGTNQFARVKLLFEPSIRSMSCAFVNAAHPATVLPDFVQAVETGFRSVVRNGPLLGFPLVACRATLLDGTYHDTDSSSLAFEIAARLAFREAAPRAGLKLLEPYLELDITTPADFVGSVIGDFKSRRGVHNAKEASPGVVAIYGFAPLANMLGYEAALKSATGGAATYSWKLAGLEEVPSGVTTPPHLPAAAALRG